MKYYRYRRDDDERSYVGSWQSSVKFAKNEAKDNQLYVDSIQTLTIRQGDTYAAIGNLLNANEPFGQPELFGELTETPVG